MSLSSDKGSNMSPGLQKVAERARRDPEARFNSLAHLIDEAALERAFGRIRKNAAVGVDGITKDQYGQSLEPNLRRLHEKMKAGQYRHQPIRRIHIPKAPGKTRPIGISAIEDKIVQGALCEVMEAIYEQDFKSCSFGFRPKRSAHDALRVVSGMTHREKIETILEADIQAFFDSLDREKLREMLQIRIADPSLLRLIGKCIHVGVLEGTEYSDPDEGTVQGSIISPMLGNVYLHYVLDVWFEQTVKPQLLGHARLIRYADDFVIGFERQDEAERVMEHLRQRMAEHGLTLHPDKTRIIPFKRPSGGQTGSGNNSATFDFLGFTVHWTRTRAGGWRPGMKTRKAGLSRALVALNGWCRKHRHQSLKEQHVALSRRIRGHYQYFGVNGNIRSLSTFLCKVERIWKTSLDRRSQRGRKTWESFRAYLDAFPLPVPRICAQIW